MSVKPSAAAGPVRLDLALVRRGLTPSRSRARDLIKRGLIEVAGKIETRAAAAVAAGDSLRVLGAPAYVSRGAVKLAAALEHFGFAVADVVALDIGASTGGFTELLLSRGAARIYAVDVGHGQLHARLAQLPAVVALEGCDARRLDGRLIPEPVRAIGAGPHILSVSKP